MPFWSFSLSRCARPKRRSRLRAGTRRRTDSFSAHAQERRALRSVVLHAAVRAGADGGMDMTTSAPTAPLQGREDDRHHHADDAAGAPACVDLLRRNENGKRRHKLKEARIAVGSTRSIQVLAWTIRREDPLHVDTGERRLAVRRQPGRHPWPARCRFLGAALGSDCLTESIFAHGWIRVRNSGWFAGFLDAPGQRSSSSEPSRAGERRHSPREV